MFENRKVD
jgi:cullin 3